jgi:hypothetical protein
MKATIEIEDALYRRLKSAAALQGRRVKDLVAEGVQRVLESPPKTAPPARTPLPLLKRRSRSKLQIPDDAAHVAEALAETSAHATTRR